MILMLKMAKISKRIKGLNLKKDFLKAFFTITHLDWLSGLCN